MRRYLEVLKVLIELSNSGQEYVSIKTIADRLKVSRSTVYYYLDKLKQFELVEIKDTSIGKLVRAKVSSLREAIEKLVDYYSRS